MDAMVRVPVREQEPKVRATNFEEVCYGYNEEEAVAEASRCLNCKNAQCMKGCPVSINIPAFIAQVKERNFEAAYQIISESSALPAVCGRVCPQESQCEGKCIRGIKGDPVAIGKLERFVADWARENGIKPKKTAEPNGHKVAVIGSGPAGLTCAGDLAKLGYDVTIFEALHMAGGVLSYGIPEFRLPKDKVVAAEVENVKSLGVKIETNVVIGKSVKIDELMAEEGFEAVFIGSGAGLPRFMGIPGEQANGVFSANEFLTRNNLMKAFKDEYETPISRGKKVVVVGGGLTGCEIAYELCLEGKKPTIVERKNDLVAQTGVCLANSSYLREYFALHKVPVYLETKIKEITDKEVICTGKDGKEIVIPCDSVITSVGYNPAPLTCKQKDVDLVGDCNGIGNLRNVIWGAYDVARKI